MQDRVLPLAPVQCLGSRRGDGRLGVRLGENLLKRAPDEAARIVKAGVCGGLHIQAQLQPGAGHE